jgi:hypothetical protein
MFNSLSSLVASSLDAAITVTVWSTVAPILITYGVASYVIYGPISASSLVSLSIPRSKNFPLTPVYSQPLVAAHSTSTTEGLDISTTAARQSPSPRPETSTTTSSSSSSSFSSSSSSHIFTVIPQSTTDCLPSYDYDNEYDETLFSDDSFSSTSSDDECTSSNSSFTSSSSTSSPIAYLHDTPSYTPTLIVVEPSIYELTASLDDSWMDEGLTSSCVSTSWSDSSSTILPSMSIYEQTSHLSESSMDSSPSSSNFSTALSLFSHPPTTPTSLESLSLSPLPKSLDPRYISILPSTPRRRRSGLVEGKLGREVSVKEAWRVHELGEGVRGRVGDA